MVLSQVSKAPADSTNGVSDRVADQAALRRTFGRFVSGVTVITCTAATGVHGMTANSFISVSLDPARALVSVRKAARMHDILLRSEFFGLSILNADQAEVSTHFAGAPGSEIKPQFEYRRGVPVVPAAIAWMVCRRDHVVPIGDHALFIGELVDCDHDPAATPLIYFGGRYGKLAS
jgi:flavin reductase (DIM6/NTAB) family NADH-FMN oxidoreductase RutF